MLLAISCLVAVCAVAWAGYYPPRPVYDYNKYDPGQTDCSDPGNPAADHGRCGSVDGPVFNSFINSPSFGDEREFLDGRRTDQPESSTNDPISDVTGGARDVTLRLFIDNDANEAYGYRTTATGTRVRVDLPTGSGNALRAVGHVTADNAAPNDVEDTVDLVSDRNFRVYYIPGTARLLRNSRSYRLSDRIVTTGAPVGDRSMDGSFPAGFAKEALVELRVKIVAAADESGHRRLIGAIIGGILLLGLALYKPTRRAPLRVVQWWWAKVKDPEVHNQVVAGVILLAIGGLLALGRILLF